MGLKSSMWKKEVHDNVIFPKAPWVLKKKEEKYMKIAIKSLKILIGKVSLQQMKI